ncbi:hypothetical protein N7467_003204 [Penicillium canescens]|nr:hypothetical protein N7467_003204 [Penicillium canescens]
MYGVLALLYVMTIYGGMGRYTKDFDPAALVTTLRSLLSVETIYGTSLGLIKTSIALFMVRIFGAKRSFNVVYHPRSLLALSPFYLQSGRIYQGTCGNRPATFMVAGVVNIVTDLMVIALPLPHVWKLKLNICANMPFFETFIAAFAPAMGSSADWNMVAQDTSTHTVQVGQYLASNAGPYGISVTQKFDVHCENLSLQKHEVHALLYI